jgi:hypothetical protein
VQLIYLVKTYYIKNRRREVGVSDDIGTPECQYINLNYNAPPLGVQIHPIYPRKNFSGHN